MDRTQSPPPRHHIVGGGIAGLAAAVFLARDAGVKGSDVHIYEQSGTTGGSLDGSGTVEAGYLTRGGRMFEPHFACTFDLLGSIPSLGDAKITVKDELLAFNEMVPGSSNCRLVRQGKPAEDRFDLTLSAHDILDINRLILTPESQLAARSIEDWFGEGFFGSNFWLMWATMFSFQPWHSLIEMRRYLKRFIHLFPGFTRISGILRTPYNQFDSLIAPIVTWLRDQGVQIQTDVQVVDVTIEGDAQSRHITGLILAGGQGIEIGKADRVYLTLGSMKDGSTTGSNTTAPSLEDQPGGAWRLWHGLAQKQEGFGHPEAFSCNTGKTAWNSFTVTLDAPDFFEFMEDFTNNRTGTGGLVTFAESTWLMSVVLFHQPHFRQQQHGTYVFWGYGLRGDQPGDFVKKPMWSATGNEILQELMGQLHLSAAQRVWLDDARIIPCRMPFITSQFMPRKPGDRPAVRPIGAANFAFLGQFVEQPRDCVFTVEYSVRSAWAAVASLTGSCAPPPGVARTDLDPRVLAKAGRVLLGL